MNNIIKIVAAQFKNALRPSLKSAIWLLRMMLPIMLLVSLLDFFGVIEYISQYTTPLFNMLGLSGKAAFVFVTSCLASIYSAIGVIALFGFDLREVTIMASMCLIAHNLIIEGAIQSRTGVTFWGITLLRLVSALTCGYILNLLLPADMQGALHLEMATSKALTLYDAFYAWGAASLSLTIKVVLVIFSLNVLQNILRAFNLIDKLTSYLNPLMTLMGLPHSTTFLWIVANSLGLAYGGAVIIEEISKGEISRSDAALLNISLSQTHSLVEDTILFVAIGVGVWWVIIPRLTLSIITVWAERGIRALKR